MKNKNEVILEQINDLDFLSTDVDDLYEQSELESLNKTIDALKSMSNFLIKQFYKNN